MIMKNLSKLLITTMNCGVILNNFHDIRYPLIQNNTLIHQGD